MATAAITPLFKSTVAETMKELLARAEMETMAEMVGRRNFCLDFYHNDVLAEDGGDDGYLKDYFGYQKATGEMVYKKYLVLEHVPLTEQLIDLKARNYREQPSRLVGESEAENYADLLRRSRWFSLSKRVEQYMQLLHDIAVGVFLAPDKQTLQFLVATEYYPIFDPEDPIGIDPIGIVYPTALRGSNGEVIYAYYDDEVYALTDKDGNTQTEEPNVYGVLPFFFPHRKHPVHNHFSTPRVSLATANQGIDVAVTALNALLHYNGFKQMVIRGVVNSESDDDPAVTFALGNAQAIVLDPGTDSAKSGVDVIDLQADFASHVETIKFKFELAAQGMNMNIQWKIEGGPQSGASLQVQNSRDTEDRQSQLENLEDTIENPLFSIVSAISERFSLGVEKGELTVDWSDPESYTSIQDEIAWQKHLLETGQATAVDLMLLNNPEMDPEAAKAKVEEVEEVKKRRAEAFGIPKQPPDGGPQTNEGGPDGPD